MEIDDPNCKTIPAKLAFSLSQSAPKIKQKCLQLWLQWQSFAALYSKKGECVCVCEHRKSVAVFLGEELEILNLAMAPPSPFDKCNELFHGHCMSLKFIALLLSKF